MSEESDLQFQTAMFFHNLAEEEMKRTIARGFTGTKMHHFLVHRAIVESKKYTKEISK